jgi:hypothetical protein
MDFIDPKLLEYVISYSSPQSNLLADIEKETNA